MNPLLDFFLTIPFGWLLIRVLIVVVSLLFLFYSILILGQTNSLRKTVITEHGDFIQFISTVQVIAALAVLVVGLLY